MKHKLKRLAPLYLASVLLFSVINCTKDSFEDIQNFQNTDELLTAKSSFQVEYLTTRQVPVFVREVLPSQKGSNAVASANSFNDAASGAVFDEQTIMKVTDTLGNVNYTIRFVFPDTPEHVFYNLIVGKDPQGIMKTPYILRYVSNTETFDNFKASGYKFNHFKGKISVHKYSDFFGTDSSFALELTRRSRANNHKQTTDTGTTACDPGFDEFGDPLPCETIPLDGGTITDGTSGSGTGTGSSLPAGGTAGDDQGVGTDSGTDQNTTGEDATSGDSGETREPEEPIDPVGGGTSDGSVNITSNSIVRFDYVITTTTSGSCTQTTITTIAILEDGSKIETQRTSGVDCISIDLTGTIKTSVNSFGDCPECVTPTDDSIGILPPLDVALFIENRIDDSNLDPCSRQILNQLKSLQNFDISKIIKRFGEPNVIYNWSLTTSLPIDSTLAGTTDWLRKSDDQAIDYNYVSVINPNFVNKATSIAIARVILHEMLHAYILSHIDDVQNGHTLEFISFRELWRMIQKDLTGFNNNPELVHHEFMAQKFLIPLKDALKEWDNSKQSDKYYVDLAWGALINTDTFDELHPIGSISRNRIMNTNTAEDKNLNQNGISPKGTPCQ